MLRKIQMKISLVLCYKLLRHIDITYLKEWVYHGCVSLHADGDCEVDGACQSYLGQGQQHRHQVGVPWHTPNTKGFILKLIIGNFVVHHMMVLLFYYMYTKEHIKNSISEQFRNSLEPLETL